MYWLAALVIWCLCGVWAYGLTFAHLQRKFPLVAKEYRSSDRRFALLIAVGGPIGVFSALVLDGGAKYGLKFGTSERNKRCEKQ